MDMIDIGGYSLNVNCYGKGKPTVIFESGLGDDNEVWTLVQPEISKNTRTFSYDRAGLGNSDKGDLPRTSLDQVHQLHTVLNKAKVKAPYIIVAHSIGGYNARLFAGAYPKEVFGIIFVDCSHENQFEDMVKHSSSKEIENAKSQWIGTEQTFDELLISANQVKQIRERDTLRNIPIVVLTSGHKGDKSSTITEETWLNYQNDLVSLSDYSKHIIVEDSSHYIQDDKPQVVIDAIKGIVNGRNVMRLLRPSMEYKQQVLEYKNEFIDNGDDLAGTSYLQKYDIYEEWMKFVWDNEKENTKHTEVAASVFLAIREEDNKLVGMINIRHTLNEYLYNYGGHIGYSVRKFERRKGYAKEMLKISLNKCIKLGMEKVLLTCDADNIASANTIKSCGGIFENEIPSDDTLIQRYCIKL